MRSESHVFYARLGIYAFLRILADDWDRLSRSNVVARSPIVFS